MNNNNLKKIAEVLFRLSDVVAKEDLQRGPREDRKKRFKRRDIDKEESSKDYKDNFRDPDLKE